MVIAVLIPLRDIQDSVSCSVVVSFSSDQLLATQGAQIASVEWYSAMPTAVVFLAIGSFGPG